MTAVRSRAGWSEPARRLAVWDGGPVRAFGEKERQADGNRNDERAAKSPCRERQARTPGGRSGSLRLRPAGRDSADEEPQPEIGDLVASERHDAGDEPGEDPAEHGAALERPQQEAKAIGQKARLRIWPTCCTRQAAEAPKAKASAATSAPAGCQPRSRKMQDQKGAAEAEHAEDDRVEGLEARVGVEGAQAPGRAARRSAIAGRRSAASRKRRRAPRRATRPGGATAPGTGAADRNAPWRPTGW